MSDMRRREFITLLGGAVVAWPRAGLAQEAGKVRRIGFLRVGEPPAAFIDGFRRGLREVGLVEGRDFVIEFALPQNAAQVPGAAAELVRRRVDILLASGTPSVLPARDAAGQIPVVFVATFDPVATGTRRKPRPAGRQHHRHDQHQRRCDSETIAAGDRAHPESLPGLRSSCAKPARPQPNTCGNPRLRHGVWASRCRSKTRAM